MVKNVVSLSGGKDSTALLLMMLEKNIPVHSAVFFDTGWEFPQMYGHIDKLESMVDVPIVRLKPEKSFDYWMFDHKVQSKKGLIGCGWPQPFARWCTRTKIRTIQQYLKNIPNSVSSIGIAADEKKRVKNNDSKNKKIYPLIDWQITEKQALQYCYDRGLTWDGLYEYFRRVSCFCCPLQRLSDLRTLRARHPELWQRMIAMQSRISGKYKGFKGYATVVDMENRFAQEERQMEL